MRANEILNEKASRGRPCSLRFIRKSDKYVYELPESL